MWNRYGNLKSEFQAIGFRAGFPVVGGLNIGILTSGPQCRDSLRAHLFRYGFIDNPQCNGMLTVRGSEDIGDPEFLRLYGSSFTAEEKIPLKNLTRTFGKGGDLRFYYDSDRFIGFTYCFEHDGITFFVYFATDSACRNRGYGSQILEIMKNRYADKKIFLVLHPQTNEISKRRHGFYLRNGWKDTGNRILSDGYYFDSMFLEKPISEAEMMRAVGFYEDCHNGV